MNTQNLDPRLSSSIPRHGFPGTAPLTSEIQMTGGNSRHHGGSIIAGARALFVGDLSYFCTEVELAAAFSPFGPIESMEIKRGRHGDSLMHGFVEFKNEADAAQALLVMQGSTFMGRKLRVNWTSQKVPPIPGADSWIQVHVNFLTPDISAKITEEFLGSIFVPFGSVADITVKRHLCSYAPAQVTGYAFVYFTDPHSALRAIFALKGGSVDNVFFECCLSYKAEQLLKDVSGMAALIKRQQTPNPSAFFKRFEKSENASPHGVSGGFYKQHLMSSVQQLRSQPSPQHVFPFASTPLGTNFSNSSSLGSVDPFAHWPHNASAAAATSQSTMMKPHQDRSVGRYSQQPSHPSAVPTAMYADKYSTNDDTSHSASGSYMISTGKSQSGSYLVQAPPPVTSYNEGQSPYAYGNPHAPYHQSPKLSLNPSSRETMHYHTDNDDPSRLGRMSVQNDGTFFSPSTMGPLNASYSLSQSAHSSFRGELSSISKTSSVSADDYSSILSGIPIASHSIHPQYYQQQAQQPPPYQKHPGYQQRSSDAVIPPSLSSPPSSPRNFTDCQQFQQHFQQQYPSTDR